MLNGKFEGGQISFTRQFNNGTYVQSWTGTLRGARMVGTYIDHTVMGVTCTWNAAR